MSKKNIVSIEKIIDAIKNLAIQGKISKDICNKEIIECALEYSKINIYDSIYCLKSIENEYFDKLIIEMENDLDFYSRMIDFATMLIEKGIVGLDTIYATQRPGEA